MQEILKKLDLTDYIKAFEELFSRKKSIILEGDINLHYKLITQLSKFDFVPPKKINNLDKALIYIQKKGILKIDDIYGFIKIIRYFLYLKRFTFEGKLKEWIDKIVIPSEILRFDNYFDVRGDLKGGFDEEYDGLLKAIYKNKELTRQSLYKIINSSKLKPYLVDLQVHLIDAQECILARGGFNHVIKGTVIHRSNSGFFYVVPHLISQLKEKRSDLLNKKEEILFRICKQISLTFEKHYLFLRFINKEFDRFDHYQARLFFAKIKDKNFLLPSKNRSCKLIGFKHPALSDPKPINVDFTKSVIMLTGVNAGGKTMMLKSILSSVLLSKYLVPFHIDKTSQIGSFKNILAILDDPQNVKNDISTFAGRMVEFSALFSKKNSIVGIDEIELGTDVDEAASLFKVIIEELIKKDIKIIVTTHHKRLAALLASNDEVELIAALYDEKREKPTYEFLHGTIGKSYAFETASRYGIAHNIVKLAKKVYGEDKDKLNELIERSSSLDRQYRQKIEKLDKELEKTTKLRNNLKEQKKSLDELISLEKSKLHKEYKEAKDEAKKAIRAKISKEGHQHLNIAHSKASNIKTKRIKEIEDLKVKDRVKYRNSRGVIVSIRGEQAFIENDSGMKMKVPMAQLTKISDIIVKKYDTTPKATITVSKSSSGHVKLDLHGQRVEEALENLDKFLSDALIAGFDEVLVYHGIGTGKLSAAIKKYLDKHPKIKVYEDAHPSSGGFGAKIIKL